MSTDSPPPSPPLTFTMFHLVTGLECLCSILKCMVEWSREYYIDPATTGLNAFYQSSSEGDDSEDIRAAFQPVETRSGRLGSVSARHQPNDTSM